MDYTEKTLEREWFFKGKVIEVARDQVSLPDGTFGERELVFHRGGVAIIALTADERIVLVRQFRKPLEKVIWEIPAGKIEPGESEQLATARRELEEETGLRAEEWTFLTKMVLTPGFSNEVLTLFLATNLELMEESLPLDEDEFLDVHYFTLDEAKALIQAGDICDAKTLWAIQYWELQSKQ